MVMRESGGFKRCQGVNNLVFVKLSHVTKLGYSYFHNFRSLKRDFENQGFLSVKGSSD